MEGEDQPPPEEDRILCQKLFFPTQSAGKNFYQAKMHHFPPKEGWKDHPPVGKDVQTKNHAARGATKNAIKTRPSRGDGGSPPPEEMAKATCKEMGLEKKWQI